MKSYKNNDIVGILTTIAIVLTAVFFMQSITSCICVAGSVDEHICVSRCDLRNNIMFATGIAALIHWYIVLLFLALRK